MGGFLVEWVAVMGRGTKSWKQLV